MSLSRRTLLALPLPLLAGGRAAPAAAGSAPTTVERFYGELLAVMKEAKRLSFDQRYARLAPAVEASFDLPLMTRLSIGPGWTQIPAAQQQRLTAAFSRYTIAMYASRFDDYGGERFEVTPTASAGPNGSLVSTRMVRPNGEAIAFNYLMRQQPDGSWKVIDVYLNGSVSELATRRSEFLAVLQRDGAEGLVQMMEQRAAALRTG